VVGGKSGVGWGANQIFRFRPEDFEKDLVGKATNFKF
jgi:hypothetical protein